jgi:hypothetical protein
MKKNPLDTILNIVRTNLYEQPVNNIGSGKIAGSVEAGDDPPVRKKKRYIYQKGVRKLWKPQNGGAS